MKTAVLPQDAICLHVPHASGHIPMDVRPQFCVTDPALESELLQLTDWFTDDLFSSPDVTTVRADVSRFVVDMERFELDAVEPMAKRGMGAIYTHGVSGARIRIDLSPADRNALLDRYYRPHHAKLSAWADKSMRLHGACLLIDAHSFPSVPLPCDMNQDRDRPDICLGADDYHTPPALAAALEQTFAGFGHSVAVNSPYAGCMVPSNMWQREPRAWSVMIEINRRLYLDESTGMKHAGYQLLKEQVSAAIDACRHWLVDQLRATG